jgi:hypothetical protein
MFEDKTIKECTRSFRVEGREFTASYLLREEPGAGGERCVIRAILRETDKTGRGKESSASVELVYLHPDLGMRIFEAIAGAKDPVFPVHLPDIVRDQIAASSLIEVVEP